MRRSKTSTVFLKEPEVRGFPHLLFLSKIYSAHLDFYAASKRFPGRNLGAFAASRR